MEVAKIHAENAIRQKNQSLNFLRMSARVDATASRVQSAVATKKVSKSMEGVVKGMSAAMKTMNLEKISTLMDNFETCFEVLLSSSPPLPLPPLLFCFFSTSYTTTTT